MSNNDKIKCAIMQPTYLPWVGYFALIGSVDVFVFLDDVEFSHQSWQQRNKIKAQSGSQWLSVPVRIAGKSHQLIRDVEINDEQSWRRRHASTILMNYAKSRYIALYRAWIQNIYETQQSSLCDVNIRIIQDIAGFLGLRTEFRRSSTMNKLDNRIGRLVAYCKAVGADEYLSPPGSFDYIGAGKEFSSEEISLSYLHYEHPVYRQVHGSFVPYMSAIDVLLNEGPNSCAVIMSGLKKPYTHEELEEVLLQQKVV
jgi:hypothetical protein